MKGCTEIPSQQFALQAPPEATCNDSALTMAIFEKEIARVGLQHEYRFHTHHFDDCSFLSVVVLDGKRLCDFEGRDLWANFHKRVSQIARWATTTMITETELTPPTKQSNSRI